MWLCPETEVWAQTTFHRIHGKPTRGKGMYCSLEKSKALGQTPWGSTKDEKKICGSSALKEFGISGGNKNKHKELIKKAERNKC